MSKDNIIIGSLHDNGNIIIGTKYGTITTDYALDFDNEIFSGVVDGDEVLFTLEDV